MNQTEFEVIQSKQDEIFKELNSKEIKNIGKSMSEDEQKDICVVISSDILQYELKRREEIAVSILKDVADALATQYDKNMPLSAMETLINKIRGIVRA